MMHTEVSSLLPLGRFSFLRCVQPIKLFVIKLLSKVDWEKKWLGSRKWGCCTSAEKIMKLRLSHTKKLIKGVVLTFIIVALFGR